MRWQGRQGSDNVEDRRGRPGRRAAMIGGGGGLLTVVIFIIVALLGGNPQQLLQQIEQQAGQVGPVVAGDAASTGLSDQQQRHGQFISVVLRDTEVVWAELFRSQLGRDYVNPRLVLFTGATSSACGPADAQIGPFYCPADSTVYIDLDFMNELFTRLGARGDFAQAYVVAHEVGHHVQSLLGESDKLHRARGRVSQREYNQLSVRLELQADFYAGVWAHHAQKRFQILEEGDLEEAMRAAEAVGDDTIQRKSQGRVVPDSFTHGTSAQRRGWFMKGFRTGDVSQGDTFTLPDPR